ncbi:MAG: aminotransferase class V-fold PLP-dependent enzyme, partial [Actinobacteria bacterium]|nr:aminotransferase class V-fold PLP-dependent enzyme [Actinomycetota bacterium]
SYVPNQVIALVTELFSNAQCQPSWGFGPSVLATDAMHRSLLVMAELFNADPAEVHFGPSTSQNTYVLAHAFRAGWAEGDEIIVTTQDHEANSGVWRRLADTGIVVREWQADPVTGRLDIADAAALITDRTRLLAVTHASNVAATVNPIRELADMVHAVGGRIVVDGVSYAPHALVDVKALDCDVYLYSAYKTFGPHIGMMFTKADLLDEIAHQGHYFNAGIPSTTLTPAGPDHAMIGAAAGIGDYYDVLHAHHFGPSSAGRFARTSELFDLFGTHEEQLVEPLLAFLRDRDGVRIVGAAESDHTVRAPTVAFASKRRSSADIYSALIEAKVSCGHGHFYAHRLVTALGLDPDDGVVRLSAVHYNTAAEIDRTLAVLSVVC